jgi:hypothetical protein
MRDSIIRTLSIGLSLFAASCLIASVFVLCACASEDRIHDNIEHPKREDGLEVSG